MSNHCACFAVGDRRSPASSWTSSRFVTAPWQARPCSPLWQGTSTATEPPALEWASPHSSEQGQEQMPDFWALATQPVARHCTEQQLCSPEDMFKVTELTKSCSQIFKVLPLEVLDVLQWRKKNTGRGCGERQDHPLQQLPAAKLG